MATLVYTVQQEKETAGIPCRLYACFISFKQVLVEPRLLPLVSDNKVCILFVYIKNAYLAFRRLIKLSLQ